MEIVSTLVPRSLQMYLRPVYHGLRAHANRIDRWIDRRTLSENALRDLLKRLGIVRGAAIFLHTSMDEIRRRVPSLSPGRFIEIVQTMLGENGTLAVPTFPFRGKQYDYVRKNPRFDAARTPSQVGLITEVFRRMPGVVRSLHPTHPVAAWGRYAGDLTSTHHLGPTFGETSPFYKLKDVDGSVVGIGTRLESYTILHVADELHPKRREDVFADIHSTVITNGGAPFQYDVRPLKPDASRRMAQVEKAMLDRGALQYVSASGLKCSTAKASDFIRTSLELIDEGRFL